MVAASDRLPKCDWVKLREGMYEGDYKVVASVLSRQLDFEIRSNVRPFVQGLLTAVIDATGEEAQQHLEDVAEMLNSYIEKAASANMHDCDSGGYEDNQSRCD